MCSRPRTVNGPPILYIIYARRSPDTYRGVCRVNMVNRCNPVTPAVSGEQLLPTRCGDPAPCTPRATLACRPWSRRRCLWAHPPLPFWGFLGLSRDAPGPVPVPLRALPASFPCSMYACLNLCLHIRLRWASPYRQLHVLPSKKCDLQAPLGYDNDSL